MPLLELVRKETYAEEDFPAQSLTAKVTLSLDVGSHPVPNAALRKIALRLLRSMVADAEPEELTLVATPAETLQVDPIPSGERNGWTKPAELDMRIVKSAHRMVLEVAQRGSSGKAVMASELVGSVGLSAPTVGRLLKDGEPAHDYVRQYLLVTPLGRSKALDLTPAGRVLASKIRAGAVPA